MGHCTDTHTRKHHTTDKLLYTFCFVLLLVSRLLTNTNSFDYDISPNVSYQLFFLGIILMFLCFIWLFGKIYSLFSWNRSQRTCVYSIVMPQPQKSLGYLWVGGRQRLSLLWLPCCSLWKFNSLLNLKHRLLAVAWLLLMDWYERDINLLT